MNPRLLMWPLAWTFACTPDSDRSAAPSQRSSEAQYSQQEAAPSSPAHTRAGAPEQASPSPKATPPTPSTPESAPPSGPPTPVQKAPKTTPTGVTQATTKLLQSLAPNTPRPTDQLTFELRDNEQIWVSDGKRRAKMRILADALQGTTPLTSADGTPQLELAYSDESRCDGPDQRKVYSLDSLQARLENSSAFKDHRRSDYTAAARGFAIAAQLDPIPDKYWTNLACALALSGQPERAIIAFGPLLRRNPVRAYSTLLSDPELSSLRGLPAVKSLQAQLPGTAAISLKKRQVEAFTLAYSRDLGMIAGVHREEDGGSCEFAVSLTIYDALSGLSVTTLQLVRLGDTLPECGLDADGAPASVDPRHVPKVQARLDHANNLLRDLGFAVSGELERVVLTDRDTPVHFPKAGLDLDLGATQGLQHYTMLTRAGYDPTAKVTFIEWLNEAPEDCASEVPGSGFHLLPTSGATKSAAH